MLHAWIYCKKIFNTEVIIPPADTIAIKVTLLILQIFLVEKLRSFAINTNCISMKINFCENIVIVM